MKKLERIYRDEIFLSRLIDSINMGHFLFRESSVAEGFPTQNGFGAYLWNFINKEISSNLDLTRYRIFKIKRGLWDAMPVYDREKKILYLLMRDTNYRILAQNPFKNTSHYLNILSEINEKYIEYDIPSYKQMSIFDYGNSNEAFHSKLKDQLSGLLCNTDMEMLDEIEYFTLITFTMKDMEVASVTAWIPLVGFNYYDSQDWSDAIKVTYNTDNIEDKNEKTSQIINVNVGTKLKRRKKDNISEMTE